MSNDPLIAEYVEELSDAMSEARDPRKRLNRLRQRAKRDGLEPQALMMLVSARQSSPDDDGASMLESVLRYAKAAGVDLRNITLSGDGAGAAAPGAATGTDEAEEAAAAAMRVPAVQRLAERRPRPYLQFATGVAVTVVMMLLVT